MADIFKLLCGQKSKRGPTIEPPPQMSATEKACFRKYIFWYWSESNSASVRVPECECDGFKEGIYWKSCMTKYPCLILPDTGSQVNLVASDLSDKIGLKKRCQPSTQEITDFQEKQIISRDILPPLLVACLMKVSVMLAEALSPHNQGRSSFLETQIIQ